jgi:hypothetical protein
MTWMKLATLALAGIALFASGHVAPGMAHDGMFMIAYTLLGKEWLKESDSKAKRPSVPPVAILFAVLLVFVGGCEFARKAWPTIRTIVDVALAQCHVSAGANPEQLGPLTAEQWCDVPANFAPFLEGQRAAAASAGGELGLAAMPPLVGPEE